MKIQNVKIKPNVIWIMGTTLLCSSLFTKMIYTEDIIEKQNGSVNSFTFIFPEINGALLLNEAAIVWLINRKNRHHAASKFLSININPGVLYLEKAKECNFCYYFKC